jgi:hypothetical protein
MATNYHVTKVKYNSDDTHIQKLHVHEIGSDGKWFPGKPTEISRPQAVEKIKAGSKFTTVFQRDGKWVAGAALEVISVETEYLKTKKDRTTRDNLESLPTF